MDSVRLVLEAIGAIIVAGGGIALIVYAVFKHLAVKWLDAQFAERLQSLQHRHQRELEELRFKIAALLDITTKLHQREFDMLPEAWSKLNDAFWEARATTAVARQYPDIEKMNAAHQAEFIDGCRLQSWEKEELRQSERKNEYYQKRIAWHDLSEARKKSRESHIFLLKNGIFFSEELRNAFHRVDDIVWDAVVEHGMNVEHEARSTMHEHITVLMQQGEPLLHELERKMRERLWPKEGVGL